MTTERDLGLCVRIKDEKQELLCAKPAIEEVLIRNKFGLFAAALCSGCKQEHYLFYKNLRGSGPKSQAPDPRRRLSQSRGNDDNSTHRH